MRQAIFMDINYVSLLQYLHPFQSREHAKSIRAIRKIGRNCIKKRIESLERGDTLPNDILTCMLRMARKCIIIIACIIVLLSCPQLHGFFRICMKLYG